MRSMSKGPSENVATFIAGPHANLDEGVLQRALSNAQIAADAIEWLDRGVAADVFFYGPRPASKHALEAGLAGLGIDVVVQPVEGRRKALLVADMDSTIIEQECIDELAAVLGLREKISAITERAMRGELRFESALEERVALLAGLRMESVAEILSERITETPGARALIATMRSHGAFTVLASGGFTCFAEPIAARIGFDVVRANRLEVAEGALTGAVSQPILGAEAKRAAVEELRILLGLEAAATLAVGDGANDLDMLAAAGLGVAFRAKPKVAAAAGARIDHADLTALLYAQGFRREDFAP